MSDTTKRNRIIGAVLVIIIVLGIVFYFSVRPFLFEDLKSVNQKIDDAQAKIDSIPEKIAMIASSREELSEYEKRLAQMESDIPEYNKNGLYIGKYYEEATEIMVLGGAREASIVFVDQNSSEKGKYMIDTANVSFKATYSGIKTILDGFYKHRVFCHDLQISSDSEGLISVDLVADYYSKIVNASDAQAGASTTNYNANTNTQTVTTTVPDEQSQSEEITQDVTQDEGTSDATEEITQATAEATTDAASGESTQEAE